MSIHRELLLLSFGLVLLTFGLQKLSLMEFRVAMILF